MQFKVLLLVDFEEHRRNWDYVTHFRRTLLEADFAVVVIANPTEPFLYAFDFPFHNIPFGRGAEADVKKQLLAVAHGERADYVLPLGDWTSQWVSFLNENLALPGPQAAQFAILDKFYFFKISRELKIDVPRCQVLSDAAELEQAKLHFHSPIVIKPTLGTGSSKMRRFNYRRFESLSEIGKILEAKGKEDLLYRDERTGGTRGHHMIQEYVDPQRLLMVNFAVIGESVHVLQIGRLFLKNSHCLKPFAVGGPEPISTELHTEIVETLKLYQGRLKLKDTLASLQFVVDQKGGVRPIDFHLRLGESLGFMLVLYDPEILADAVRALMGRKMTPRTQSTPILKYGISVALLPYHRISLPKPSDSRLRVWKFNLKEGSKQIREQASLHFYLTVGRMPSAKECWEAAENFAKKMTNLPEAEVNL